MSSFQYVKVKNEECCLPTLSLPGYDLRRKLSVHQFREKYISELEMIDNTGNLMSKNDKVLDSKELSKLDCLLMRKYLFLNGTGYPLSGSMRGNLRLESETRRAAWKPAC